MPQHPQDTAIGLKEPNVAFVGMIQFEVGEQVADKFASLESEGFHAVASTPVSQNNALTFKYLRIKCHCMPAITHQGRERGVVV